MPRETHTRFFLRDDDVGALSPALHGFIDVFAGRGLPVSYQVIPAKLEDDCASYVSSRREQAPDLFEFSQHGLTHEMVVRGRREFYEFGPELSYQQQLEIVQSGQSILRRMLGSHFNSDVFTPPRHKYDRNTLLALQAAGVKVLSAASHGGPIHRLAYGVGHALGLSSFGRHGISYHGEVRPDAGLLELSVSVIVDNGRTCSGSVDDVLAALEAARTHTPFVGLMFHHEVYADEDGRRFLNALADRLLDLPDASFHLLGDLAGRLLAQRAA